jgi:hypothetical protein
MAICIGDIHGEVGKLTKFLAHLPKEEHIILGDVVDSFSRSDEDIMLCMRLIFSTPKVKFIVGNHDIHYFTRPPFRCTGFRSTLELVYKPELVFMAHRNRIYAALERDGILLTHAGVHEELALHDDIIKEEGWLKGQLRHWLDDRSFSSPIFNISRSRGGYHSFPGIFWLDHRSDSGLSKKYFQVFGHSADKVPYVCDDFVCLDTTNHPGVWVYDTKTRELIDISLY